MRHLRPGVPQTGPVRRGGPLPEACPQVRPKNRVNGLRRIGSVAWGAAVADGTFNRLSVHGAPRRDVQEKFLLKFDSPCVERTSNAFGKGVTPLQTLCF